MIEESIIENLNGKPVEHNKALSFLFTSPKYKMPIMAFLSSKGLNADESNILWTDIVVKFALLVKKGKYEHQGKMLGYIKNLSNYMLLNFLRDRKRNASASLIEEITHDPIIEAYSMNYSELKHLLEKQLGKLGESCKELLLLWAHGYSMNEIMSKMKLISPEATRKRKHSCMKKLLVLVNDNQKLSELLEGYYNDIK